MSDYEVLCSPFDIETHKKTFIHYFEVILCRDGTVVYAVPSHQEKLIAIACEKLSVTREQLSDMCPPEYYGGFMEWLCKITGCCALWEDYAIFPKFLTVSQKITLLKLTDAGLYYGRITTK